MEIIGKKYIILEEIGNGGQANVFLVRDKQNEKLYAAKLYKENICLYYIENEKEILKYLKNLEKIKNSYIANYIDEVEEKNQKYLIIEYATKGSLFNYLDISEGFSELYGKLLFKKILIAVKSCHDAKVCHRDLKSDNIILNGENFNPLICDFGYSYYFKDKEGLLTKYRVGTKEFNPPEILMNKPYNGYKVDIFCLGIILFDLITNIYPFESSIKTDKNYSYIINKQYKEFWDNIEKEINYPLSNEFKNLFLKMVSYKPKKRPKNIDEILNDDWFKEINNKEDKEIMELENELKNEFIKREKILKKETQIEKETNEESSPNTNNRDSSEFKKIYFNDDLMPDNIDSNIIEYMEHYIKIKGYLEGYMFMNCFANNLQEKEFEIEESDKNLEFNIIIRNQEEENEEQKEEENKEEKEENDDNDDEEELELIIEEKEYENDCPKDLIIQVKLFKIENKDKEHILRFLWESGNLKQYYEVLKIVIDEAKKIL